VAKYPGDLSRGCRFFTFPFGVDNRSVFCQNFVDLGEVHLVGDVMQYYTDRKEIVQL